MKTVADIISHLNLPEVQENLTPWEKGFTQSLSEQYSAKGFLSNRQIETLKSVYDKHSPEKIKNAVSFKKGFKENKELQELWASAIQYYEQNPPYYGGVVQQAKADENFTPTKKLLENMTGNKFFQRWLALKNSTPLFKVGDLVKVHGQPPNATFIGRADKEIKKQDPTFSYYNSIYTVRNWGLAKKENHLFMIEEVCDFTFTSSKGSKLYRALDISGDCGTMYLEQRMMKEAY